MRKLLPYLPFAIVALSIAGCAAFLIPRGSFRGEKVNRDQLDAKVSAFVADVKATEAEIDRKERMVADLMTLGATLGSDVPYGGAVIGLAGTLLAGFGWQQRGKAQTLVREVEADFDKPGTPEELAALKAKAGL